jgi:hypothetical protein
MGRTTRVLIVLAALVGVTAAGAWYYDRRHQVAVGDVTIIDADTIKTTAKGRIRFKHCDAPEWFQTGGEVAAQRLIALVKDAKRLEITYDSPPLKDWFGRWLGVLMIDGDDACAILIREKLACRWQKQRPRPKPPDCQ